MVIPSFATFGARLKYWRERRGFKKQGDFAQKLGIAQPSLSELEKGHSKEPMASVLLKASDLLQLRPKYLLLGEGAAESRNFSDLNGLEAQLVMIFRQLPTDALRDALLIEADDMLKRNGAGSPSVADPSSGAKPTSTELAEGLKRARPPSKTVTKRTKKMA